MTDGRFELWYGLIIMGLGIPVFIHHAMRYILRSTSKAHREGKPWYSALLPDADPEEDDSAG